MQKNKKTTSY